MKTISDIKEYLTDLGYADPDAPNVILLDSPDYATAFIGISSDDRAVYDYNKMVEYLVATDGMTYDEASDMVNYDTICSIPLNGPIVVYPPNWSDK